MRILGVLQRIALAYGFASILCLYLDEKKLLLISESILIGYWLLLLLSGGSDPYSIEHNLVRRVDLALFGANHLWQEYGVPFDPEGLLSTLPAVVNVIFGYLTGRLIQIANEVKNALLKMFGFGLAAVIIGKIWDVILPINKPLWTSSYVLYTTGIALILFAVFIWLIDIKGVRRWTFPFTVYGTNPLFVFALSELWMLILWNIRIKNVDGSFTEGYDWVFYHLFQPLAGNYFGSFLFAISHVLIFWLIAWLLYRKKIVIKI